MKIGVPLIEHRLVELSGPHQPRKMTPGEGEVPPKARWITLVNSGGQFGFDLRCSPILAADILEEYLWSMAAVVIVTSATMTALNSF